MTSFVFTCQIYKCYDLAKLLSHYLYFFSFSFWTYYIRIESVGKYHMTKITCHSHKTYDITRYSHDDHGKVVHRPCSSCISSVQKITGTSLSSSC